MNILTKNIILLFVLIFAANSFGCDYPTSVSKGDVVDCRGIVMTHDQFIEASNNKRQIKFKDMKISELESTVELMEFRHSHYKKKLNESNNRVTELEIKSNIGMVVSFSLGAVITGLIAKELVR